MTLCKTQLIMVNGIAPLLKMSSLTWLDYSEADRRRMLEIVDLFRENDTRDELGLGSVRDAFADGFFPGTSTIMTRAKYFLLVPWTYQRLEKRRVSSAEIAATARKAELDLVEVIERSDDKDGNIGKIARRLLKRLPSSVYWQGLGVWSIRTFAGAQAQYHRSLDRYYANRGHSDSRASEKDSEPDEVVAPNWRGGLLTPPDEFPKQASLRMSRREAQYLCERIRLSPNCSKSLLAELVTRRHRVDDIPFAWEHPLVGSFPAVLQEQLLHARNFSEIMHGAVLLYNLILAEQTRRKELREEFRSMFSKWTVLIRARDREFVIWDRTRFWRIAENNNPRIPFSSREFVNSWWDLVVADNPKRLSELPAARELIRARERRLKRKLARIDNPEAHHLWSGASGIGRLDFRWNIANRILRDLFDGLESKDA